MRGPPLLVPPIPVHPQLLTRFSPPQHQRAEQHLPRVPEGQLQPGPGGSQGGSQQPPPPQQDPRHLLQTAAQVGAGHWGRWTDGQTDGLSLLVPPSLPSEVDKVLAGLEILSKVFDQQSSPMVSKILQQVRGAQRCGGANPHPGGCPHGPAMALFMGTYGAGGPILPLWWSGVDLRSPILP